MKGRNLRGKIIAFSLIILLASASVALPVDTEWSGISFEQSIEKTRKVAIDALVALGFDLKRQDVRYIEGYRPRKTGYVFGSGGEIVAIWITQVSGGRSRVLVETAKSPLGYTGQKDWEDEIVREMKRIALSESLSY